MNFGGDSTREFPVDETHGIAHWPSHRLLTESRGRGWRDVYTSLATESNWARSLKAVPHYCLAYCMNRPAEVRRTIDSEARVDTFQLRPRLFGVIPPDRTTTWNLRGSPDVQLVYLRRTMVDEIAQEIFGSLQDSMDLLPRVGFSDGMLEQLVLSLLCAARDEECERNGLYADHLAHTITLHLLRAHSARTRRNTPLTGDRAGSRSARMEHVRDLINTALEEDLSLTRLAREADLSPHAFASAFVRNFGVTPHRYVLDQRIETAKRLLRDVDLPIATIAIQTGFANQSHLSTAFKRAVGVTPGEYQRGRKIW